MRQKQYKTFIGVQGSVMGWDDPWHYKLCSKLMRTGERQYFPSQDSMPSPEEFISLIKDLGVDFYLHQIMPDVEEINNFICSIEKLNMPYFIGNEFGNINKTDIIENNRYDFPESFVEKAKASKNFMGLFYDETEHLQLHPDIYTGNRPELISHGQLEHQWASTVGKTLQQIEDDVAAAVSERIKTYGGDVTCYSEQVFPVMYHTLARGGMNPCPKVMKEEFQSVQLSTALGAAKQYNRKMGICADLWGPDAGQWFTRLWGFPGHSPAEYKSALEMAYLMGPEILFTENIDPLVIHKKEGFQKTEFGEIFEKFIKDFVPENPRHYNHSMVDPDIAVIRSDDTVWSEYGGFNGRGLYGSLTLKGDYKAHSVFKVFNLISHGCIPQNGIIYFLPQYHFPAGSYIRNVETLKQLPLLKGVEANDVKYSHTLFYPMNNVTVFDERVNSDVLGNPKIIFMAGSRMTSGCLKAVEEKVRNGAVCVAAKWLMPKGWDYSRKDASGKWIVTEDFLQDEVKAEIEAYLGDKDCWMQRFGAYEARFYNPSGDGVTLTHEVRNIK